MGNFEKIIIKKERDKIRRETLGKFFFDLAKCWFSACYSIGRNTPFARECF